MVPKEILDFWGEYAIFGNMYICNRSNNNYSVGDYLAISYSDENLKPKLYLYKGSWYRERYFLTMIKLSVFR